MTELIIVLYTAPHIFFRQFLTGCFNSQSDKLAICANVWPQLSAGEQMFWVDTDGQQLDIKFMLIMNRLTTAFPEAELLFDPFWLE